MRLVAEEGAVLGAPSLLGPTVSHAHEPTVRPCALLIDTADSGDLGLPDATRGLFGGLLGGLSSRLSGRFFG
jgi:hypothetical protein